jgi:hypothetical protein
MKIAVVSLLIAQLLYPPISPPVVQQRVRSIRIRRRRRCREETTGDKDERSRGIVVV